VFPMVAAVAAVVLWALALDAQSWAAGATKARQREMVRAVNHARARHDLRPLRPAPRLERSAGAYARWMLRADYFGHLRRIRASRRFDVLGETLAWHRGRRPHVRRTVRAWLHSPPHRALILSGRFQWIGAGTARGGLAGAPARVWVLHLGG
jgi:uncharacterized protein YkwD